MSLVKVPVLSNASTSTLPAYGILKGSVQNIFLIYKNAIDWFTAIDNIMGSSGGTTVVTIIKHLKNSLFLSLLSFSSP
mgnify:CR=1 FL=1